MSTLAAISLPVHSNFPIPFEDDFAPSLADEAYAVALFAGLDGEDPALPPYPTPDRAVGLRFTRGARRGRQIKQAEDLGYDLGRISELSEPPLGLDDEEREAFRKGFRRAKDDERREFKEDRELEAWIASEREEWMDAAFDALPLREIDNYSPGYVS